MNPDPEPSSSDSSETYSSDSRPKKKNAIRRKSVVSIRKMTRQTNLRLMNLILLMTVITDASDAKIRNIVKRIRSNNGQL